MTGSPNPSVYLLSPSGNSDSVGVELVSIHSYIETSGPWPQIVIQPRHKHRLVMPN